MVGVKDPGPFATTVAPETGLPPELTEAVIVTVWPRPKTVPVVGLEIDTDRDEAVLTLTKATVSAETSRMESSRTETDFEGLVYKTPRAPIWIANPI
jgi:hypothetical protein